MKWLVRGSIPIAAILVPAAFFLSVLSPNAKAPNGLIYLAYVVQMVGWRSTYLRCLGMRAGGSKGSSGRDLRERSMSRHTRATTVVSHPPRFSTVRFHRRLAAISATATGLLPRERNR